jgi:hypothetical protein
MPRFFFDTFDGNKLVSDEAGLELESVEIAKAEAQKCLPEMAKDALPDGNHRAFVVNVRDEAGKVMVRMALSLVIEEGPVDDQPAD